jgi:hypothetical protein
VLEALVLSAFEQALLEQVQPATFQSPRAQLREMGLKLVRYSLAQAVPKEPLVPVEMLSSVLVPLSVHLERQVP